MERKIILIDQDNVLANLEDGLRHEWEKRYPRIPCYLPHDRKTHSIKGDFSKGFDSQINSIIYAKNFSKNLNPIPGAIDSVREISKKHNVFICTTPLLDYTYNLNDKSEWIKRYLGTEMAQERIIFTRDKTLINADFLIDDAPEIIGLKIPSWEHIIFDRSYNQHIRGKRRINWRNWKEILPELV